MAHPPEWKARISRLLCCAILASTPLSAAEERPSVVAEQAPPASATETRAVSGDAAEPLPVVRMNDSLRIPPDEIPILQKKAERGDPQAALKLASYYGVYLNDKETQLHYYKLAAKNGSLVAIENLVTMYSRTDANSFDFEKALRWRWRLKELARKKGIEIESDAEWAYGLYLDHLTDKDRGLFFLKYAASHGSEKARNELIQNHPDDPNTQVPEKTRDSKERSDASNLTPSRTLALVSSARESRLGSSIDDFRSIWGPPSEEESLVRTASLKWNRGAADGEAIVPGVFAIEVAFLDGIACEIALRSKERITHHKLAELTKPFLTTFRKADFAQPLNDARTYKLSDETLVWANRHNGHTVIVIKGPGYTRNEDVFDREAATVRPPTSNH